MKAKLFFVLLSLGTFNYFLAATHGYDLNTGDDDRKISTQIKEIGDLYALSGNVSFLTDIPEGNLKLFIYPYGVCEIETDPQCFTHHQALAEIEVAADGTFLEPNIEDGEYSIIPVIEKDDNTLLKVEAIALGGVNLDHFLMNTEIDIQIAISHKVGKEIVLR